MRFEPRRDRDVCFQRTPQRAWRDLGSDRARPTHEAFGSYCPEVSLSDQARAGLRACEHAPMARPTLHGFPIWSPKSVPSLWISFSHTAAGQPRNHTGFPFKCSRLEPGAHQHDGDTRFHVHRLSTLDTGANAIRGHRVFWRGRDRSNSPSFSDSRSKRQDHSWWFKPDHPCVDVFDE